MYVSDEFVFLELQKTGCSHVVKLFEAFTEGQQIGKHQMLREIDEGKKVIGSIRNPWEWYISLWAYGCAKRGGLYKRFTQTQKFKHIIYPYGKGSYIIKGMQLLLRRNGSQEECLELYEDVNNPALFREWLKMLLTEEGKRVRFGEGFAHHSISSFAGLLTFRYCRLFCKAFFDRQNVMGLTSYEKLLSYDKQSNMLEHIIRQKDLENNFIETMNLLGYPLAEIEIESIRNTKKTNTSNHKDISY
jgi:hypothetical protein